MEKGTGVEDDPEPSCLGPGLKNATLLFALSHGLPGVPRVLGS